MEQSSLVSGEPWSAGTRHRFGTANLRTSAKRCRGTALQGGVLREASVKFSNFDQETPSLSQVRA